MHYFIPKRCVISNKIMYHDKVQAQRAADSSFVQRGAQLWVYRCEYCGAWHLTHRDPETTLARGIESQGSRGSGQGQRKPRSRKRGYKPRRK
ncbi:hypothetical protein [Bifidobacterium sp.]|uniref:hypothetical protein n=1 Tax=Bifidobacterium sp. TaxID=41200 RepID=UPI0025BC8FC5|nr:hypothetical protein [Bifidobacterium sp.]MCH4210096.1 hypothetical protein [Bifidobacterium sp.]MCI1225552.1 hypothetical protein [Bifidobacterium sp.]